MHLLLDTRSVLWRAFVGPRSSSKTRTLIADAANDKFLGIVPPWEIGIKVGSGRLPIARPVDDFFAGHIRLLFLQLLPSTLAHAARFSTLPLHHRDPLDRMLVQETPPRTPMASPAFDDIAPHCFEIA